MDCFQGVIEQSHRKRGDKMSRARQGGLRPNRRHVQRGSDMISFVLDVGGKIQSAFPRFFHQPPIPGRWQPCRTVGRNPAVALVAQLDRASDHGSGGCGFESLMGHYPLKPFRTRFEKISTGILPIDVPGFFLLLLTGTACSSCLGVGQRKKKRLQIILDGRFESR